MQVVVNICVMSCLVQCAFGISWGKGDFEKYGPFRMMLNSPMLKCIQNRSLELDVNATIIYFYDFTTNLTESYPIADAAQYILDIKTLDKNRDFVLFVGGFKSQINKKTEMQIREAYLTYPNSYLIIPDHSPYTNNKEGNMKGYKTAVMHVHYIGKALGDFLGDLKNGGVTPKNMHCVGHSLGGQILGHTGERFYNITGQKIARITALDPAGPCFSKNFIHEQIRSGVADYVEVYHCNSGGLGTSSILGDVDFMVNRKGETQPNCGTPIIPGFFDSSKAATCAHRTCIDVWTASVKNKELFPAYSCDSYKNFKDGKCNVEKTIAGAWSPLTARGIFYVSTNNYDLKKLK